MEIAVSIVSHGHADLIRRLGVLPALARDKHINVIVRDNLPTKELFDFCYANAILYCANEAILGFGENNNLNFKEVGHHDFFCVLNPDVKVDVVTLKKLCFQMSRQNQIMGAVRLYRDEKMKIPDFNLRSQPSLKYFLLSPFLINKERKAYFQQKIKEVDCLVESASGAFLVFNSKYYQMMGGFDPRFFMYCEDLDICRRAYLSFNKKVLIPSGLSGIHIGAYQSRGKNIKHLGWHVASIVRLLWQRTHSIRQK